MLINEMNRKVQYIAEIFLSKEVHPHNFFEIEVSTYVSVS